MTKEELEKEIKQTLSKRKVQMLASFAENKNGFVSDLLALSFSSQKEIAFRAAWILETVAELYPLKFYPIVEDFLMCYSEQKNRSCQRHYTKILMYLFSSKVIFVKVVEGRISTCGNVMGMPDHFNEPIINATFEWLIDPQTPVAVQVNCLDILCYFSKRYAWIREELEPQIAYLLRDGSAAMQSRGKRVLRRLKHIR